jgi:hypothetical protein
MSEHDALILIAYGNAAELRKWEDTFGTKDRGELFRLLAQLALYTYSPMP